MSQKAKERARIHPNSQLNTCWIYSLELKINKKIDKYQLSEYLDIGWIKGRKMKFE